MSKEILYVAEALSNEKNVSKEVIYEAIEIALATATRKKHRKDMDVKVIIDTQQAYTAAIDAGKLWLMKTLNLKTSK